MFETFRNAWKIEDLRKKLLYTLLVIVIFRLGCAIPVPFIAPEALQGWVAGQSGSMLGYIDMLTGGSFSRATLFALSVTPYINASIIIQLLTVAIPALERLSKEGEDGRKKLTRITRYTGAGIALALGVGNGGRKKLIHREYSFGYDVVSLSIHARDPKGERKFAEI